MSAGKGDARRPGDLRKYEEGWERVFNKDGQDGKDSDVADAQNAQEQRRPSAGSAGSD